MSLSLKSGTPPALSRNFSEPGAPYLHYSRSGDVLAIRRSGGTSRLSGSITWKSYRFNSSAFLRSRLTVRFQLAGLMSLGVPRRSVLKGIWSRRRVSQQDVGD